MATFSKSANTSRSQQHYQNTSGREQLHAPLPDFEPFKRQKSNRKRSNLSFGIAGIPKKLFASAASIIALALGIINLIPESNTQAPAIPQQSKVQPIPAPGYANKNFKLHEMAINIMQDEHWDVQKVHLFNNGWQSLNQGQQAANKDAVWFQLFENALTQELNKGIVSPSSDGLADIRRNALVALANTIELFDSPLIKPKQRNINSEKNSEKVQRNRVITKTIKPATPNAAANKPKIANNKSLADNQPKASPGEAIAKEISNEPASQQQIAETPLQIAKISVPPNQTLHLRDQQDNEISKKPTIVLTPISPTHSELNDITTQFVDAYDTGNFNKLVSLFSNTAVSSLHSETWQIKRQYAELFDSTAERQMFINDLKWSFKKNKAIGKGTLEIVVLSSNSTKPATTLKGRLQFVTEKHDNKVFITRFYHLLE